MSPKAEYECAPTCKRSRLRYESALSIMNSQKQNWRCKLKPATLNGIVDLAQALGLPSSRSINPTSPGLAPCRNRSRTLNRKRD
uniref:Uncharacterized protein n=1 Tax=Setaria italica TaxID=4555 RepID=K3Y313_SETIT